MDPPIPQRRRGGTLYMPFPAKNATPSADDEKPAEPVVRSKSCRYSVGASELKGRRPTMEDASVVHGCFGGKDDYDLFCVFDGHGSRHSAAYCAQHLPDRLAKKLKDGARPDTALRDTFVQVADELKPTTKGNGTTAAVALIVKKKLWVANVGDSRVVLCRGRSSAVEAREKEKKAKEEEKQRLAKEEAEKQEKERLEKEKKKQERKEKERQEKERAEKEANEEGEGGGAAGGKRPMERKERSCSKSLCLDRGSSPSSPSRVISPSSPGPSSPLTGTTSPTKLTSSSALSSPSTTTGRENEDSLCPSSGPSSSPSSSILRRRPHTYSSPAPETNSLPKLSSSKPSTSEEGGGKAGGEEGGKAPEKEFDSDEDSNDDSNVDPFASDGEGSNDDSALSDPFKSEAEEKNKAEGEGGRGSDGEDSNDDSAISDPFGSDGSNDDSAISDPFGSDGSNDDSAISDPFGDSENDNPDSDIIMSDCEEEEEDPIPDYMASRLSYDHRPDSVPEQERIKGLGGVIVNGRVGGQLAVTRAIGDAQLFPFVSPEPHISETELKDDDEFIVIACDGLFDVFPDDVVVTIARGEKDPIKASDRLSRQAFGAGSTDNISVIVVRLLN